MIASSNMTENPRLKFSYEPIITPRTVIGLLKCVLTRAEDLRLNVVFPGFCQQIFCDFDLVAAEVIFELLPTAQLVRDVVFEKDVRNPLCNII